MPYDPLIEDEIKKRRQEFKSTPQLVGEQFFDSTIGDKQTPPGDDSLQEPLISPIDVIPYEKAASALAAPAKAFLRDEVGSVKIPKDDLQKAYDSVEKFSTLLKDKLGDKWYDTISQSDDPGHKQLYDKFGDLTNTYADLLRNKKLPLDMSESARMDRAKKMGFDVNQPYYHATDKDFSEFSPGKDQMMHFGTPEQANTIANQKFSDPTRRIMPVYLKSNNPLTIRDQGFFDAKNIAKDLYAEKKITEQEFDQILNTGAPYDAENPIDRLNGVEERQNLLIGMLKKKGYDSIKYRNRFEGDFRKIILDPSLSAEEKTRQIAQKEKDSIAVFDPSQIRSKFAAFDPNKAGSGNISAGLAGAGIVGAAASPSAEAGDKMDFDWSKYEEEKGPSTETLGMQPFDWNQYEEEKQPGLADKAVEYLPEIGAAVGGIGAGMAAGPVAAVIGAAGGGFAGKLGQNLINDYKNDELKTDGKEIGERYLDEPISSAIGSGVGEAAGYGVGKLAGPALKWAGKRGLTMLGPSGEAIEARLAGKAQDNAKNYAELAEGMGKDVRDLAAETHVLDQNATKTLSGLQNIGRTSVTDPIDKAIGDLTSPLNGRAFGPQDKKILSVLEEFKQDARKMGPQVSESQIKAMMDKLDKNIDWKDNSRKELNTILKGLRRDYDYLLKVGDPTYNAKGNLLYQSQMPEVSKRAKVLDAIQRKFNLQNEPGAGLRPTDTTAAKIKGSPNEMRNVTRRSLDGLADLKGNNYRDLANDYRLSQQFATRDVLGTAGARRAVGGLGIGLMTGNPAIGAGAGAAADVWGGRWAAYVLDAYRTQGPKVLKQFGPYAPAIQKAVERGPDAMGVLGSILGADPEFRKTLGLSQ